jgi:hypothetical protein
MLIGAGAPGQAKDYPYSGYFALVNSQLTGSLDPAMCAFNFFHQLPDGLAISYHIDLAQFEATKAVRHVEYNWSKCTYNESQGIETCTFIFDTDKTVVGQTLVSVIDSIRGDYIWSLGYGTPDEAKSGPGGSQFILFRCPFDTEKITTAITGEISKLAIDDRNKITWPSRELLTAPTTAEIMRNLGLGDMSQ